MLSMRKIFLLLFLVNIFLCYSQKIELERLEDDGRRQLMSSPFKAKLDGEKYEFRLKAYEKNGSIDWCILVTSKNYIPENAVLLLCLSNNDNLEIPINNYNTTSGTIGYGAGGMMYFPDEKLISSYVALFALTEQECLDIENYGIVRIRISSRNLYNEKVWKKDNLPFSYFFSRCREMMLIRLETTPRKSMYDGLERGNPSKMVVLAD